MFQLTSTFNVLEQFCVPTNTWGSSYMDIKVCGWLCAELCIRSSFCGHSDLSANFIHNWHVICRFWTLWPGPSKWNVSECGLWFAMIPFRRINFIMVENLWVLICYFSCSAGQIKVRQKCGVCVCSCLWGCLARFSHIFSQSMSIISL